MRAIFAVVTTACGLAAPAVYGAVHDGGGPPDPAEPPSWVERREPCDPCFRTEQVTRVEIDVVRPAPCERVVVRPRCAPVVSCPPRGRWDHHERVDWRWSGKH